MPTHHLIVLNILCIEHLIIAHGPVPLRHLLVELAEHLLRLEVFVELEKFAARGHDVLHLVNEYPVQLGDIVLYLRAGKVDFVEQQHLLFDEVNDVVDMVSVLGDEGLLLLQDLLYQFLVVVAEEFLVVLVLQGHLVEGHHLLLHLTQWLQLVRLGQDVPDVVVRVQGLLGHCFRSERGLGNCFWGE